MKWLKKVAATPLTTIAKVVDSLSATTNDRTNAPSIHAVREAVNNNWLNIYPIGSIYMSVNNTDPSLVFGGTWEQIKQRFLIAADDDEAGYNGGSTGGAFSRNYTPQGSVGGHALTVNEIPSHNHGINASAFSSTRGIVDGEGSGIISDYVCDPIAGTTENRGGGAAHNHGFTGTQATINTTPPYLAVYMWKRIA
nr:MAG TPA: baseplate protein [Caudoviricetes sp.]